jgi:hypothetical protein
MSAKVYSPPKEIDFDIPFVLLHEGNTGEYEIREHKAVEQLRQWCKENTDSNNPLVGETIRTGVADGYAQYMVFRTRPLELIHIPVGDAWHADDIWLRGLRVSDIKKMVEGDKAIAKLFAEKG